MESVEDIQMLLDNRYSVIGRFENRADIYEATSSDYTTTSCQKDVLITTIEQEASVFADRSSELDILRKLSSDKPSGLVRVFEVLKILEKIFVVFEKLNGVDLVAYKNEFHQEDADYYKSMIGFVISTTEIILSLQKKHKLVIPYLQPSDIIISDFRCKIKNFRVVRDESQIDSNHSSTSPWLPPELKNQNKRKTPTTNPAISVQHCLAKILSYALSDSDDGTISSINQSALRSVFGEEGSHDLLQTLEQATSEKPNDRYTSLEFFLQRLKQFSPSSNIIIPQVSESQYFESHWLSKIIDLLNSNDLTNDRYWMDQLSISPDIYSRLRLGLQIESYIGEKCIKEMSTMFSMNTADFRILIHSDPSDFEKLIQILEKESGNKYSLKLLKKIKREQEVSEIRHLSADTKAKDTTQSDVEGNAHYQMRINHIAALGIEDLIDSSNYAFQLSPVIKNLSITSDPNQEDDSHISYSSSLLAERSCPLLFQHKRDSDQPIRIVEGGVGGTKSALVLMRKIHQFYQTNFSKELKFQYRGYELVPRFAWMAEQFFNAELNASDGRTVFFGKLRRRGSLEPLPLQTSSFVQNCSMDVGLSDLRRFFRSRPQEAKIDLCLISYALHHVPNGAAIRIYLSEDGNSELLSLKKEPVDKKNKFRDDLIRALDKYIFWDSKTSMYYPKTLELPHYPRFRAPVRNLWRNLDWIRLGHPQFFDEFKLFVKNSLQKNWWFTNKWLTYIRNIRQEMFVDISNILRPNGLLLIADPDGTGIFNQTRWKHDAEATIANFEERESLERNLIDLNFRLHERGNIIKEGTDHFTFLEESRKKLLTQGMNDMGYIVVASKL